MRTILYTIGEENAGMTLENYLRKKEGISHRLVKLLKQNDGILLNGRIAYASTPLRTGDAISVLITETESSEIAPSELPLTIAYEDDDFIVADKPAGQPTHPSKRHQNDTLSNAIAYYFARQSRPFVFRALNRLDMDTSGLVLIAKNLLAGGNGIDRVLYREYTGLVDGVFPYDEYRIELPIARISEDDSRRAVCENGQHALTNCRRIRVFDDHTLMSFSLETGRTHQIRVHMSHLGFPICGDAMYGGCLKNNRQALHCSRLSFITPASREPVIVTSKLPDDINL